MWLGGAGYKVSDDDQDGCRGEHIASAMIAAIAIAKESANPTIKAP